MDFNTVQSRDQAAVLQTYKRFPVALVSGKNARCTDVDGKNYIDFTSGIGVNALGYSDPGWAEAVAKQASTLQHTSNLYYTLPCIELAETLTARSGMQRAFFSNSGAESNEGAIKAARKYSFQKYGEGRSKILCLQNSFHGRTVTTLSATGQDVFHQYFFPFTEGFVHVPANDFDALTAALTPDVCAIMVELVQGEGGVIPLEKEYVQKIYDLCHAQDILLIVDEVQTGIGRTGSLFCYQQFGIEPDIVSCAKGLGGGLPLGCVLFGERAVNALGFSDHATTFGGNPVACAGGLEVLRRLDDTFLKEVREKGAYIREKLLKMPHVAGVSGMGMMLGITLEGVAAPAALQKCIEKGVLVLTAKTKLRLLPPLSITYEEIDEGLCALAEALSEI